MIFDSLFELMAGRKASDLFIAAGTPIHIKIEGNTLPINQQVMTPLFIRQMLEEALTPAQLQKLDSARELNVSFGRSALGNFRVNVMWQRGSMAVVVRFVQSTIPTLQELRLPPVLREIVMEKRGLVLVVGATGSGKTTTLASMLDYRSANRSGHILTIEDPIEYLFEHRKSVVNQREIGIDTLSWEDALSNAMRQAPDCILIGEIRDRETMQAAIAYSQTGHLCLATLHANNAYHALNRIVNFFPLENRKLLYLDLGVALRAIVSQRLVRKIDGARVPAVELLMNTRLIADLITAGELEEVKDAMEKSLSVGSQTFEQALHRLYKEGLISHEEAQANADSPHNLNWLIDNDKQAQSEAAGAHNAFSQENYANDATTGASFKDFTLNTADD